MSEEVERYATLARKSAEVDSCVRHHAMPFADACALVVIADADYIHNTPEVGWIPTPDQIREASEALHSGAVVIDRSSAKRWAKERKRNQGQQDMRLVFPQLFDAPEEAPTNLHSRTVFRPGTPDQLPRLTTRLSGASCGDATPIIHGLPNIMPTECGRCGKAFRNPAAMRMHSRECVAEVAIV